MGCRGNVKELCSLMILENKSVADVMFVEEESHSNVFHSICYLGHFKLLLFLESTMDQKEFIEHIFLCSNDNDQTPVDYAVAYSGSSALIKHLFDKKEIQARYKNNDPMIFQLFIFLFALNSNFHITDYVLSALQIDKEKVIKMLSYKCPQQGGDLIYHKKNIFTAIIVNGTLDHLRRIVDFIGEQALIDNVFNVDKNNADVMKWALFKKNLNVIEYVLSFDQIKEKYMTDNDSLHYLCGSLNQTIKFKEGVKYVVDTLGLTEAKLSELNEFRAIEIEKILPFTK